MMDVLRNHGELITESNRVRDSAIRFWKAWLMYETAA